MSSDFLRPDMFMDSSSELEDLSYNCPKCLRKYPTLQSLRDHLDIAHLYQPTRDTDDETHNKRDVFRNYSVPKDHFPNINKDKLSKEGLEIERQLHRAKELELRHQIFHRHTKSQDELKVLNSEILGAKQRQYEMCNIIHTARTQIESLRDSAEKVTADQHSLINRLKQELSVKDDQLDKTNSELRRLAETRIQQQDHLMQVAEEKAQHREALVQLSREISNKEKVLSEKQTSEVSALKEFISTATQKELDARKKLEQFINGLLDRAEVAEDQVREFQKHVSARNKQNFDAQTGLPRSFNDRNMQQTPEMAASNYGYNTMRSQSAEPMINATYGVPSHTHPSPYYTPPPPKGHDIPMERPVSAHSSVARASPAGVSASPRGPQIHMRKLPSGPFYKSHDGMDDSYPVPNGVPVADPVYAQRVPDTRHEPAERWKRQGRDADRPESGYSSLPLGASRPQSTLSSVSEMSNMSTDTVVPARDLDFLRSQGIIFSDDPDVTSDLSESDVPPDLPVDEHGILWENESVFESLPSKHSSLTRSTDSLKPKRTSGKSHLKKPSMSPANRVPSPLNFSRFSSINSTDKEILKDVNKDAKFEIQRYKFLLRDRLRMLKEQEKLFRMDGRSSDEVVYDSDLTSVTDEDTLSSLTFSSGSESEDNFVPNRKQSGKTPSNQDVSSSQARKPVTSHITASSDPKLQASAPPAGQDKSLVEALTRQRRAILFLIFMYLDTATLGQVAPVCREWLEVSRHPALWRRITLSKGRMTSKYLYHLAKWCSQLQSLTLEGLRARPKKSYESFEEYKKATRGSLEEGLGALYKTAQHSLQHIRIVDCGNILTDRCLWLASCNCFLLQRVTYISDTDPVGPEVIWSLGAGCRDLTILQVPPLYPKMKSFRRALVERAERFSNRCVQMISWCWPELKTLSIGGKHINIKGLIALARNCASLNVLELHQMAEVTEEMAVAMCHAGLKHLHNLDINYSAVSPGAVKHFLSSCPELKSLKLRIGISDYFSDVKKTENKKTFEQTMKKLQDLKKNSKFAKILTIEADSK